MLAAHKGGCRGMKRILIHGATILTLDPRIGDLRGDILVEGARIVAVAPSIPAKTPKSFREAHDCAAGLCRFPPPYLAVAVARRRDRLDTCAVFRGVRGVMGRLYTPDDMYVANYLGALEALDAGITTLYDWSHNNNTPDHADEAVRGLKDAGLRAVFGYGNANDEWIPPSTLPTNFADVERVRRSHFSSDDQL